MRTVLAAVADAGAQPLVLPARSVALNWTSVSSSAVIAMLAPGAAPLQLTPPSVDVRYS